MKSKIIPFVILLAAGALGGCATDVTVLQKPPTVPYEVLGKVRYMQQDEIGFKESSFNGDPERGLGEKAAALGADAVIVTARGKVHPTVENTGVNGSMTIEVIEGLAIRYKKAGGSSSSPSPSHSHSP